jgi:uncharacterized protein YukE/outer membrane lipoprotein SlyB
MLRARILFLGVLVTALMGVVSTQAQVFRSANEAQVRSLLQRLETKTDTFRTSVERRTFNSRWNDNQGTIQDFVADFENATDALRSSFNGRRSTVDEANEVMEYAWYIDNYVRQARPGLAIERQWSSIRTDLDQLARYYSVSWNWNRSLPPFAQNRWGGDRGNTGGGGNYQIRAVLERLETKTDTFRNAVERQSFNRRWNDNQGRIQDFVADFENATDALRANFNGRGAAADDASRVMEYAWYIDNYVRQSRPGMNIENQWASIRTDLDQLASYYSVTWNWNRTMPPFAQNRWETNRGRGWGNNNQGGGWTGGRFDNRITGSYRLNASMSDDPRTAIDRALGTNVNDRQRASLERRLSAPQSLALEVNGDSVTMATNLAQPVSFTIDGRAQTETNNRGATTRTTVTRQGNTLTISTEGDRSNDFWVSFEPVGRDQLRMTRRIYLEGRNEMITVSSTYDRTSAVATWPPVDRGPTWNTGSASTGTFYIPNGTRLTAVLRDRIASNVSQVGDRFTMEVTSPNVYRGALITGRVVDAQSSGRVTGRANIGLDFETIQMNGQTYTFAGIIDSARETDGDVINVNNEGTVRDSNQTTRTVTRAGIGAVLGAVIGAIAGGGEGAAIGAAVGAGAGAGSVLIQGRDNIDLQPGSEFTITASAPSNAVGQGRRY